MDSVLKWMGNKKRISKVMDSKIEGYKVYVEPFAGGLGYGLRKRKTEKEAFNDLDGDVMNVWRVIRDRCEELVDKVREYDVEDEIDYKVGEEVKRARDFIVKNRSSFFGDMVGDIKNKEIDKDLVIDRIRGNSDRLKDVVLEEMDFLEVCERYDGEETVIFLDPPYYEFKDYKVGYFGEDKYMDMVRFMRESKGKVIVTLNDCERVRELFKEFKIEELKEGKLRGDRMKEIYIINKEGELEHE